jgi:hypothetical protein
MRPSSPVPIYVGIAVTALGLLSILVAWSKTATTDAVALQVPYLLSGGLVGIALVMIGLTLTVVQSRRIEGQQQAEQVLQVAAAIAALHEQLLPTDDDALSVKSGLEKHKSRA